MDSDLTIAETGTDAHDEARDTDRPTVPPPPDDAPPSDEVILAELRYARHQNTQILITLRDIANEQVAARQAINEDGKRLLSLEETMCAASHAMKQAAQARLHDGTDVTILKRHLRIVAESMNVPCSRARKHLDQSTDQADSSATHDPPNT